MSLKQTSHKSQRLISATILLVLLLAACTPAETANPEPLPVNTATNAPTASATITATATKESTYTPTTTPKPTETLSPEEVAQETQEAIRAEVLSYGINLDDLANSDNEYISNNPSVELWQEQLNHSFDSTEVGSETMVVLDIEQLRSEAEYKRAVTTDGGWKFIVWAKVAYKTSDNLWAMANLPLYAYNEGTETIWIKYPEATQPMTIEEMPIQGFLNAVSKDQSGLITYMQDYFERVDDYRLDTGTIFKLYTEYPDPNSSIGDGELGEMPRYSAEQLELFRCTGDASIFEYQAADGSYFIWPFYSFFSVSPSNN